MNILGHNYVAWKVLGRLNELTIVGSEIPDIVPFVPDSVFTFEEIHESGEKFLKFLDVYSPKDRDLALAMMCHSVKFGVDKFNHDIIDWLLEGKDDLRRELTEKISDCASLKYEVAYNNRLHNYLWAGVDLYLMDLESGFVETTYNIFRNMTSSESIINLLSEWAEKDPEKVERDVNSVFGPYRRWDFRHVRGYVCALKDQTAVLKGELGGDNIDPDKGVILLQEIYETFGDQWSEILEKVISQVQENMKPYL